MRIAIVGIGGIGGYLGSHLAEKYVDSNQHEIVFVQRGVHGKVISQNGLRYISKTETITKPSNVIDCPSASDIYDIIIFSVKSKDLESAALLFKASIHTQTVIITTLNGVNNVERLKNVFPENVVLNGCIYVSASITSPSVVTQIGGAGNLFFGPEDGSIESFLFLEKLFVDAGVKAVLTSDIKNEVWKKYFFISSLASITSLYDLSIGAIVADENKFSQWLELINEIVSLAAAFNAQITKSDVDAAIERAKKVPFNTPTSMQLDFKAGNIPELDVFTQFVVEKARSKNISTPLHNEILSELKNKLKAY